MNQLFQVNLIDVDGLIEFSENTPWRPQYPKHLIRRFLTELTHYYDTYEMRHSNSQAVPQSSHREIVDAIGDDADEVNTVLCDSFAKNLDTSIPERDTWHVSFLRSLKSHFYLWRVANTILGFASLVEDDGGCEAEIRTTK